MDRSRSDVVVGAVERTRSDVVAGVLRLALAGSALAGTQDIWWHGRLGGLVYFTNQSGLLLAVVMVWAGVATLRGTPQPPGWLKGGVTLFLLVTALVAYFVLPPGPGAAGGFRVTSGFAEHRLDPVLAFVDFVLVDAHRRLRPRHAAAWLGYLVAYSAAVTARGLLRPTLGFPYAFLDVREVGGGGWARTVALLGGASWLLGLLLVGIDRVLPAAALVGTAGRAPGPAPGPARGSGPGPAP
ncbi:Pr6Pr family membrane protein [Cellulomonas chitinilytica]|uniref:Pr6Pr family membrane protein n=1 Tax=Cellulomonas chitinilytica TaxID=398759 RepID=UPI001EF3A8BE|nr:Pr6Pr family membrane protein [Cellulomonas chitinilytica]